MAKDVAVQAKVISGGLKRNRARRVSIERPREGGDVVAAVREEFVTQDDGKVLELGEYTDAFDWKHAAEQTFNWSDGKVTVSATGAQIMALLELILDTMDQGRPA